MARPRNFDLNDALGRATRLFWSKGYFDTSTRDIVDHLALGRQSIYNAFGDKESLFGHCLQYYEETILSPRFTDLESTTAGRQEIVRFLAQTVDFLDSQPENRSCMLSIVASGASHKIPIAARSVVRFHQRLNLTFERALSRVIVNTAGLSSLDPGTLARGISCTVHGMAVVSKQGGSREELVDIASSALQPLY